MSSEEQTSSRDYSFLQSLSTKKLQDILRRDMALDRGESDSELIWKLMEALAARDAECGRESDEERALVGLRETISRREAMFAGIGVPEADGSPLLWRGRGKRFWFPFSRRRGEPRPSERHLA